MSNRDDNFVVIRTVDSIQVGNRHRKDLGDIDALAASIQRDGLLQPITVTPEGVLVCGARRLAAIKQLAWAEVRVWVRSGISTQLGYMLAEQNDNMLHKPLSQLEAAELYREMKVILAEDAAQRKAATQFVSGENRGMSGPADSAGPSTEPRGDARRQAAEMVTGTSSYTRLEEINFIQRIAEDSNRPEEIRAAAQGFLDDIRDEAPVHPCWQQLKELLAVAKADRDVLLHRIAEEKLAELRAEKKPKKRAPRSSAPARMEPMPVRAFVITWAELGNLYPIADPVVIAAKLTQAEANMFFTVIDNWVEFADRLREALEQLDDDDEAKPNLRAV
ncbi:chromosome partitioning protein ParB [Leucobacter sp. UCD-THU]|uniref:ParB N-terminal domain-containing protein n=1 Tax=Leucobacter sp. UCD-THU TaxID=1292023 RepID=UPI00045F6EE6|nr:ParB N-terminal domain-containing protein [Leucobacter sp. UCD-THU]EYT53028.1 chromosome partitioning protein ParB [Leucobacter sp. UCD-THU]